MRGSRIKMLFVGVDFLCFLAVFVPLIIFQFVTQPRRRGFFCNDASLSYPYIAPQTIPNSVLIATGIAIVVIVVFVVELFCLIKHHNTQPLYSATRTQMQQFILNYAAHLLAFLVGGGICLFATDVGKYSVGRLRPHFFAICKPDWKRIDCSKESHYITQYNCTGDAGMTKEARLSFPSGHASTSFYAFCAVAIYLQRACPHVNLKLFVPILQGLFLVFAFFVSISRIFDYFHHPTDVLTGGILGTVIAIYVNYILIPRFKRYVVLPIESHPLEEISTKTSVKETSKSENAANDVSPSTYF